ncbi:DUF2568 domain-containing protein [Streptomyces sp. NPDC050704]|uniref:DUF2568 domain-containing protein n=1 Tax=Streptomyces sp. NPDC050704 TaxID=3157219 RepID=UPI00343E6090
MAVGWAWVSFAVPDDPSRPGASDVHTPGPVRLLLELAVFFGAVAALDFAGLRRAARQLPVIMVGYQVLAASPARSPTWRRSAPPPPGPSPTTTKPATSPTPASRPRCATRATPPTSPSAPAEPEQRLGDQRSRSPISRRPTTPRTRPGEPGRPAPRLTSG